MNRTREARTRLPLRGYALCLLALLATAVGAAAPPTSDEFPRSALEIRGASGRQWFDVAVADTSARQELGLMFVLSLASDAGMLFPQQEPHIVTMWMKNTLIPLDMLFIDARGHIVCLLEKTKPKSLDIRSCDKPVKAVLEINGGEVARRGIRRGDRVTYTLPSG